MCVFDDDAEEEEEEEENFEDVFLDFFYFLYF